jgi:O-antigen/teichoic acid export membrane protein
VVGIGSLIRFQGWASLLAGSVANRPRVRDEKGLTRWVGTGVMTIGVIGIVVGPLLSLLPEYAPYLVVGFVLVAMGGMFTLVSGLRRFMN